VQSIFEHKIKMAHWKGCFMFFMANACPILGQVYQGKAYDCQGYLGNFRQGIPWYKGCFMLKW